MNPDDLFKLALRIAAGSALGLVMVGGVLGWAARTRHMRRHEGS
jgi:hypothetical protein